MAGMNGAETGPLHAGMLSSLARQQYAALAAMRWQIFRNSLRSGTGVVELGARTVSYLMYAVMGLALSAGLGFGAYAMVSSGRANYLPILFWAVFLTWQLLPILLTSFQEQFDLGILLRFPLGFVPYFMLYLIFGLIDVSTITGGLCAFGLWAGMVAARPDLWALTTLGMMVFAGFNILLVRAIFAWIDRWLAQRRSREIVGAIFLLCVVGLQLLNPALHRGLRNGRMNREERVADRQRMQEELRPWMERADAVQRWLPPGLAAQAVGYARQGELEGAFDSLGLLAMYGLAAALALAARLSAEYAGENLGEAPGRRPARTRAAGPGRRGGALAAGAAGVSGAGADRRGTRLSEGSGPVAAVMEKEVRALLRTLPLLYSVGVPLLMVVVFAGISFRTGPQQSHQFALALPVCVAYAQLGFIQLFYNSLGAEGMGIQLYFLSPTPFGTVMLAKNLFHGVLFGLTAVTAGVLASLRLGMPDALVLAASVAWLLFALPCNMAAGNILSITMAYRINPGRMGRQRGSQASSLLSFLVQLGVISVGATVFWLCWTFDAQWMSIPVFLVLAGVAAAIWRRGLRNADAMANRHKDSLIATLARTE
jgi:ABC-2 type transport system permease protein